MLTAWRVPPTWPSPSSIHIRFSAAVTSAISRLLSASGTGLSLSRISDGPAVQMVRSQPALKVATARPFPAAASSGLSFLEACSFAFASDAPLEASSLAFASDALFIACLIECLVLYSLGKCSAMGLRHHESGAFHIGAARMSLATWAEPECTTTEDLGRTKAALALGEIGGASTFSVFGAFSGLAPSVHAHPPSLTYHSYSRISVHRGLPSSSVSVTMVSVVTWIPDAEI
jgi:hypothetical protein